MKEENKDQEFLCEFLAEHKKLRSLENFQFFRNTNVPEVIESSTNLTTFMARAMLFNNRSRSTFVKLGWVNNNMELLDNSLSKIHVEAIKKAKAYRSFYKRQTNLIGAFESNRGVSLLSRPL